MIVIEYKKKGWILTILENKGTNTGYNNFVEIKI